MGSVYQFVLSGGLNLSTAKTTASPSELFIGLNYEQAPEIGYERIKGYAPYDDTVSAPPGTGPILGVNIYKGSVYAVREDSATAKLYVSSGAGWTEITLPVPQSVTGKFRFYNHNFYAQPSQIEMFMVSGEGKCIKYDGTTATEITTGASPDEPSHVYAHRDRLVLAQGAEVILSTAGNPSDYLLAGNFGVGYEITSLNSFSGILMVQSKENTTALYGYDESDWEMKPISATGAIDDGTQAIAGDILSVDNQGLFALKAAQAFGDFKYSTLTPKVASIFDKGQYTSGLASVISRSKNQYRLFKGANGLYMTFSGPKLIGTTSVRYNHDVLNTKEGFDLNGDSFAVFGSTNGTVYQFDKTNFFDGDPVSAYLGLHFSQLGAFGQRKCIKKIDLEVEVDGANMALYVNPLFDYKNYDLPTTTYSISDLVATSEAIWDVSTWGSFTYGAVMNNKVRWSTSGIGEAIALQIASDGTEDATHKINSAAFRFENRGRSF